ncbi:GNAT family N-acetyltransferase [Helicobacter muridarum]|uniref:Aminoalkylphosphonic acid N-acetyltransferase n=1 Tax=Helicobacter muridarum TaxID=216 RepID=A0A099TZC9_9HELI|nr:GNAT family N-acetyltransferase [Helicobacter muridarum]TLD99926.1 GNAT family N-acetyltransferase [Helicobacter muridarum]STQ86842.1 aminoalkylphosphonic acid N-acetyltransferase [Helicobacter muridarum]
MQELITPKEIQNAYNLMQELRPYLSLEEFTTKVAYQQENMQYRLFASYHKSQNIIGLCGVMPFFVLYREKCLYICDFIIAPHLRGQGLGQRFLQEIEEMAKKEGYSQIELSSNLKREEAHRFYEKKMNFQKMSYVFVKSLK